jgi:hypothetical protein
MRRIRSIRCKYVLMRGTRARLFAERWLEKKLTGVIARRRVAVLLGGGGHFPVPPHVFVANFKYCRVIFLRTFVSCYLLLWTTL